MDAILVLPSERPAGIYLLGIREADGRQIFQKVLMQ